MGSHGFLTHYDLLCIHQQFSTFEFQRYNNDNFESKQ